MAQRSLLGASVLNSPSTHYIGTTRIDLAKMSTIIYL